MTPSPPTSAIRYDPYDIDIDNDPYPTWTQLRDEAPLYWNAEHEFWALSRWDDVRPALLDWDTYRSGRGTVLDIVKAGVEIPPGIVLFEDPPIHDAHRGLLSRVFTPRRMLDLEPLVRDYAVQALDALLDRDEFDIISEFGVEIPLRTIGFLFGIPESVQDVYRKTTDEHITTDGSGIDFDPSSFDAVLSVLGDYVEWRSKNPGDDLMTELLNARGRRTGRLPSGPHQGRGGDLRQHGRRRRQRNGDEAHRFHDAAAGSAPRSASADGR